MTTITEGIALPQEVEAFLTRLRRALWFLPKADQRETLAGVIAHVEDSLDAGATAAAVLVQLGTPEVIAEQAAVEFEQRTGRAARPRFLGLARVLQFAAFAYALVIAVWSLFREDPAFLLPAASQGVAMDLNELRFESLWDKLLNGTALWGWQPLLEIGVPIVITLAAVLLIGRAWRPGIAIASGLLAGFLVCDWTGAGFLPPDDAAVLMVGPALVLEFAALLVPYRAKTAPRLRTGRGWGSSGRR